MVFRWSWLQGRDGRRRGSRVGSYWLLIGRPATNSLNYRLYFLASPPSASTSCSTTFSSTCLHLLARSSLRLLLSLASLPFPFFLSRPPFSLFLSLFLSSFFVARELASLTRRCPLSLSLSLFSPKGKLESSEKSSADLITWNNRRSTEPGPRFAASIPTLRDF